MAERRVRMSRKILVILVAVGVLAFCLGMAGCGGSDESDGKEERDSIIIAGSTSVQPLSEAMAELYMEQNPDVAIEVQGGGSGQGIKSIKENIADIGALSREVKSDEKSAAAAEYVIAKDGIAVVVNKDVKVENLTIDQIRKIYTGKIKNWRNVGGDDRPITVVSREEGAGTRSSFTEITGIAADGVDHTTKAALVQPSTGAIKKTVAKTPDSIGYISLNILDDTVKSVKVEGTAPTVDNVLSGRYQIQRPFLYVVNGHISETTKAFIGFIMGEEGQRIVEETGFIPVN
ncbi:phosphate ABC transporter substrate-binding protein [Clostridiales bacterium]|nr:phosphate ABC transporter substrate-binding protein [Clostridiales bacterium]